MSLWDTAISPIIQIINKIIPDKAQAAIAIQQLQELQLKGELDVELQKLNSVTTAQSDVDKIEAASPSVFVAGWRPMIGWICAAALGYQYLVRPIAIFALTVAKVQVGVLPGLDDNLWQLLFAMLGMGALRSYDKVKGTASPGLH